ncbi:MAG: hypothetical protein KW804_01645 [Candidatus Doudnabacteria bacterium]|nr:hypothetical protein [Candidatus Doudnabacteria bacterium]
MCREFGSFERAEVDRILRQMGQDPDEIRRRALSSTVVDQRARDLLAAANRAAASKLVQLEHSQREDEGATLVHP